MPVKPYKKIINKKTGKIKYKQGQPKSGEIWRGNQNHKYMYHTEVRIMSITEGWVMARYKGAVPFIKIMKDFLREFEFVK